MLCCFDNMHISCSCIAAPDFNNKTIGDEGITVDFWIIKVHTSN